MYEIERTDGVASEKAILVRVILPGQIEGDDPLDELAGLAKTAGARVVGGLIQRRETPDVATYLGKGKVEELKTARRAARRRRGHLRQRPGARPDPQPGEGDRASRCSTAPS